LSSFAIGQLCRRLGLPLRTGGQLCASKVADAQAMQEATSSMLTGILAGSNFLFHSAGWLEGGLTMGYEKFVMDLDHCGMMLKMMCGLEIDDNALAGDAFIEAGPGVNFFGTAHTMKNFETANYMSDMADTSSFEQWSETGSLTMEQRANKRWKNMLAEYEQPAMDEAVDEALKDFIARKKQSMPDEWY
jgi:trimethylamine--corrinoid protein Co-methyltransferase